MKNLFKFGFLALALSLTVVACSSEQKTESSDTIASDTVLTDTTVVDTVVNTEVTVDTTVVKN